MVPFVEVDVTLALKSEVAEKISAALACRVEDDLGSFLQSGRLLTQLNAQLPVVGDRPLPVFFAPLLRVTKEEGGDRLRLSR